MKKNNGFIMIIVLGFSLAFSFIVLFFNYKTKKYIDTVMQHYKNFEMERICELGFEIVKELLKNDKNSYDYPGEGWGRNRVYNIEDYDLEIIIKDENSKININKVIGEKGQVNQLLLDLLKNLFLICGYPSSLLDSLLDWIDEDNLERPAGAEYFYYSSLGFKNLPPNKKIKSLRELFLIKGYDKEVLEGEKDKRGILDFITIYSDDKININTCEKEILNAMGFKDEEVNLIMEERENKPLNEPFLIKTNREVFLKNKNLIKYSSNYFHVFIKVKSKEGDEKNIEGIIKKDKTLELIKRGIL
jgi:type II secretory pathway component PulK